MKWAQGCCQRWNGANDHWRLDVRLWRACRRFHVDDVRVYAYASDSVIPGHNHRARSRSHNVYRRLGGVHGEIFCDRDLDRAPFRGDGLPDLCLCLSPCPCRGLSLGFCPGLVPYLVPYLVPCRGHVLRVSTTYYFDAYSYSHFRGRLFTTWSTRHNHSFHDHHWHLHVCGTEYPDASTEKNCPFLSGFVGMLSG